MRRSGLAVLILMGLQACSSSKSVEMVPVGDLSQPPQNSSAGSVAEVAGMPGMVCAHPETPEQNRTMSDMLSGHESIVVNGVRVNCLLPDKLQTAGCFKAQTRDELARLTAELMSHPPALEIDGKIYTCIDGRAVPPPECYHASSRQEFQELQGKVMTAEGLVVQGKKYECLSAEGEPAPVPAVLKSGPKPSQKAAPKPTPQAPEAHKRCYDARSQLEVSMYLPAARGGEGFVVEGTKYFCLNGPGRLSKQ